MTFDDFKAKYPMTRGQLLQVAEMQERIAHSAKLRMERVNNSNIPTPHKTYVLDEAKLEVDTLGAFLQRLHA